MMHFHRKDEQGISAIFVHAGAGFHSYQSESVHMWVCDQAAKLGLALLQSGGTAVDAVEVAVKFFEDHEVTNAGYGSNLTAKGTVECDATVVDHLGRSGAVGALGHVKNPIALARLVLDASIRPMSLNRVPPNLLVGSGATDFAYEVGVPVLPADFLMSHGARQRWLRWKRELDHAESKSIGRPNVMDQGRQDPAYDSSTDGFRSPSIPGMSPDGSPVPDMDVLTPGEQKRSIDHCEYGPNAARTESDISSPFSPVHDNRTQAANRGHPNSGRDEDVAEGGGYVDDTVSHILRSGAINAAAGHPNASPFDHAAMCMTPLGSMLRNQTPEAHNEGEQEAFDNINDTVGAIAIDSYGNIAAGSSSGGIGMKHCGRTGPAALVGIGTAVIPIDPDDEMKTCTAVVASGTGEHIATTMTANTCAERIYSSVRKVNGEPGEFESITEDEAMAAVINKDFMGHPAVNGSHCHAAIGLVAVKMTTDGIGFFFGHNTESFAVASATSVDDEPWGLMSRSKGDGKVAQGGRFTRFSRYRTSAK